MKQILIAITIISLLSACKADQEDKNKSEIVFEEEFDTSVVFETDESNEEFYEIPTPNALFDLINEVRDKASQADINSTDNLGVFTTKDELASAFGIYATDLAYLSSFEVNSKVMTYFSTLNLLADELNLLNIFDKTIVRRLENNSTADSLSKISENTYLKVYNNIRENGDSETLAIIVASGWVESIYLLFSLEEKLEDKTIIKNEIDEQYYTLESLVLFLDQMEENEYALQLGDGLSDIYQLYTEALDLETEPTSTKKEDGEFVFDGGDAVHLNDKQYQALYIKVKELRQKLVTQNWK